MWNQINSAIKHTFEVTINGRRREDESDVGRYKKLLGWYLLNNIKDQTNQHIDARSKARFDGTAPEPRKGIRSGHIPGSKCVPFPQMLDSSSHTLLPTEDAEEMI
ncbi:hypothetical protein Bca4012_050647 [Brassica carinata]